MKSFLFDFSQRGLKKGTQTHNAGAVSVRLAIYTTKYRVRQQKTWRYVKMLDEQSQNLKSDIFFIHNSVTAVSWPKQWMNYLWVLILFFTVNIVRQVFADAPCTYWVPADDNCRVILMQLANRVPLDLCMIRMRHFAAWFIFSEKYFQALHLPALSISFFIAEKMFAD